MEKSSSERTAATMCKQNPSGSPESSVAETYNAFLDALLTNFCCANDWDWDVGDTSDFHVKDRVMVGSDSLINNNKKKDGDNSRTKSEDSSKTTVNSEHLAESILPHLRFNPLNNSSAAGKSSLDDFYNLFLKDDAPHSFLSFHNSKGDEQVKATPWMLGKSDNKLERTITFITKFTPKNLQEPREIDVSPASLSSTPKTITDINNPTLTLAVTSRQTLSRRPSTMILESQLSFDFVDYSLQKTSLSKMLNLSLTQFLISNDVEGSEVNVRVVLKEEDGDITKSTAALVANGDTTVTHPFLLPDRLSVSKDDNNNITSDGWGVMSGNPCNVISPIDIGASLLAAIRERNGPTLPDSPSKGRSNHVVDEAAYLIAKHNNENQKTPFPPSHADTDEKYDVLRTASSRGSLRFKHISSFEAGINPGEMTMRRMLWEKDGTSAGDDTKRDSNILDGEPSPSSLIQSFDPSTRGGLSMHIEMDVQDSTINNIEDNNSSNNSLSRNRSSSSFQRNRSSSSFQRSRSNGLGGPSIAYIEEKVRKGIKKRVARSYVTWANSWCCRLWEDEQMERFLKKGCNPVPMARKRSNTRPTVRRIGQRRKSSTRLANKQIVPNVELDTLSVMLKQIESAEAMKARVVTPTASPEREKTRDWAPLQTNNGEECRWMASEESGTQCGVEVCTVIVNPDDEKSEPSIDRKSSPSLIKKKFIRLKSKS